MALIYAGSKSAKKQNKKVGWKKEQEEYEAWLAKHGVTPTSKKQSSTSKRPSRVVVTGPTSLSYSAQEEAKAKQLSLMPTPSVPNSTPKEAPKVHDPRVLYKDNPEMLERELKARERKFMTAPAYNKGGDMLVTPEMMKDIMAGGGRRRS
jgi:hypothetical protein